MWYEGPCYWQSCCRRSVSRTESTTVYGGEGVRRVEKRGEERRERMRGEEIKQEKRKRGEGKEEGRRKNK